MMPGIDIDGPNNLLDQGDPRRLAGSVRTPNPLELERFGRSCRLALDATA
jgi:hypothetical protein